jgi:phospholipid/cholesterol/gamma-HCH transport system ATP-binding protein
MRLSIHGLVQRFPRPDGGQATVLDRLDLETGPIRTLVLVGPSGGGKSTLLRILAGLDVPVAGSVSFDGVPLPRDERGLGGYRRTVGTVFQAFNLFPHLTAMDNLLLPLVRVHGLSPAAAAERVREPLRRFGLEEHAGKRPAELSGGPRQRIAILRALVVRPQRLFLDEPTSGLDPIGAAEFDELIVTLRETLGLTVYMVTHDLDSLFSACDRIAVLGEKRVLLEGNLDAMLESDNEWVQSYFRGKRARQIAHGAS